VFTNAEIDESVKMIIRDDFRSFVPIAWDIVLPGRTYKHGWHIDCICDHLQAVAEGHLKRLLINIPPRHMKSLLVSIMYPAWRWLGDPSHRFIGTSYSMTNSLQFNTDSRLIIEHENYRNLILPDEETGLIWKMKMDQNAKGMFENTANGRRFATSVGGALTGQGADTFMIDDPHNVQDVTPTTLEAVKNWYQQAVPSRLNDPKTGSKIIIQQRVHEEDLTGVVLDSEEKYTQVILPARYEGTCRLTGGWFNSDSGEKWVDAREKIDEPLWEELYDDETLKNVLESVMTAYTVAGQLQQRPAPEAGGELKRDDFILIDRVNPADIHRAVRAWDFASTEDGGDWTVGALLLLMKDGSIVLADICRGQWAVGKRLKRVKQVCTADFEMFGGKYEIYYEQEAGGSGKDAAIITKKHLTRNSKGVAGPLMGCKITYARPSGDKIVRAQPYIVEVQNHNFYVLDRPWTETFLREQVMFPNGSHDDQVDAAAYGVVVLEKRRRRDGLWGKGGSQDDQGRKGGGRGRGR